MAMTIVEAVVATMAVAAEGAVTAVAPGAAVASAAAGAACGSGIGNENSCRSVKQNHFSLLLTVAVTMLLLKIILTTPSIYK